MSVARVVVGFTAVITAVFGLNLATAGPAAATVSRGTWVAYDNNRNPISTSPSTWRCGSTQYVAADVVAQVCAIRAVDGLMHSRQ